MDQRPRRDSSTLVAAMNSEKKETEMGLGQVYVEEVCCGESGGRLVRIELPARGYRDVGKSGALLV